MDWESGVTMILDFSGQITDEGRAALKITVEYSEENWSGHAFEKTS